jgi:hypothetical protein
MNLLVVLAIYERKYHTLFSLSQYIAFLQLGITLLNKEAIKNKLRDEEERALHLAMEYSTAQDHKDYTTVTS